MGTWVAPDAQRVSSSSRLTIVTRPLPLFITRLPTRMIDFYHNALDAIHVATLGAKNKHGAIWAVDPTSCHSTCK